ncbi:NAD(+) synthase [Candidatus Mycoplasma pogonae]
MNVEKYFNYLVEWVREEVKKAKMEAVVVGLSGGVDSALVAAIAKAAMGENAWGIIMPADSNPQDQTDALKLVQKLNLNFEIIDLNDTYQTFLSELPIVKPIALANIKPRLRMTTLYAYAQEKNALVLGTDNYAEYFLGYFTKYGDGGVDLLPIVNLTKGEVYQLAQYADIPQSILDKAPSAGLWEGQTDEAELGFTYKDFDQYVTDKSILADEIIAKIEYQHQITQHKRLPLPRPQQKPER